ncbi:MULTISPECIES: ion transporter [unclassified Modicisalibacter]|uniref:ion transporter n=1 Tax=unclassified Modicisalibacter TaxID=2679913 RepID=UPI001CC9A0F4|nr:MULTISPECIES: ion transporter [unclassified Modicisalibacter]MBZ9559357.1 ion transporter [Modicisalibacter sp. R2A 31.J]MBZ9576478.1 ion transporter [Modicisalibacter sp. MOD 31.J]
MEDRITPFQLFILVLSFYVLGALIADTFFALSPEVSRLLQYIDLMVCVCFFIDFCLRFRAAKNKWHYMRWGWIDLLASIPAGWLMGAKAFRVVQLIRLLRALKSLELIWRLIFRNKAKGVLASAATLTVLLVAFSALVMLLVESPDPDSPIDTAEEALWWAVVTVTTVGYGDYYPVTTPGRVVAVLLMVCGVGLFGSFAAYISSLFVADQGERESRQHRADREMVRHLNQQMAALSEEVQALREVLARHYPELDADAASGNETPPASREEGGTRPEPGPDDAPRGG